MKKLALPAEENKGLVKALGDGDFEQKQREAKKLAQDKLRARTLAKQQQIAERIATASEQLSSSIEESSGAAKQLSAAMEEITSGAQEASANAEESRTAINQISKAAEVSYSKATEAMNKIEGLQQLLRTTFEDIEELITGVNNSAKANIESAKIIAELEKQADQIGQIVQAVVRIADQTNLLALNAAIEAARAGEHGKGFAVVADEVRNLAEISEKSAREITNVISDIQKQVKLVSGDIENAAKSATEEVEKAKQITKDLISIDGSMKELKDAGVQINKNSQEAQAGAGEFLKGAEQIAAASEEQSSACEEATKAVNEQVKAYNEMSKAANDLSEMAEALKHSTDAQKSAEELAAAAEELSANVEESNTASAQILQAISQIAQGAKIQVSATAQAAKLADKLEAGARNIGELSNNALNKTKMLAEMLKNNKVNVDNLIANILKSAQASTESAKNIKELEKRTRMIDKIIDQIVNVTIQTNMLAVNGSIEAARAGEYGRGFSVVAADIRTLASDSAENADKIKDMVRAIQYQIAIAAQDIEAVAKTTFQQVETSKKSTNNLNLIDKEMEAVYQGVEEIAKNSEEAITALKQARTAVDQISIAARQTEKAVTESQQAATEAKKALQEISAAIEDIASQADEMQNSSVVENR